MNVGVHDLKTYWLAISFVLKKFKVLKKILKIEKNFEGPLKLNKEFSSKTKVRFFHLILWAFKIKIKREKKLHIRFALRAPY